MREIVINNQGEERKSSGGREKLHMHVIMWERESERAFCHLHLDYFLSGTDSKRQQLLTTEDSGSHKSNIDASSSSSSSSSSGSSTSISSGGSIISSSCS